MSRSAFDLHLWKVTQTYAWHKWHACFFLRGHRWIIANMRMLLFHWHSWKMTLRFLFYAVTSFVSRDDQNVFHVLCAELKRQMRFAVFWGFFFPPLLACRLKHLMGFLLREVEIREKPTVCTVPCLGLISLSICVRHCSGDRVRIRFLTPGGEFSPYFLGVCKLTLLW